MECLKIGDNYNIRMNRGDEILITSNISGPLFTLLNLSYKITSHGN